MYMQQCHLSGLTPEDSQQPPGWITSLCSPEHSNVTSLASLLRTANSLLAGSPLYAPLSTANSTVYVPDWSHLWTCTLHVQPHPGTGLVTSLDMYSTCTANGTPMYRNRFRLYGGLVRGVQGDRPTTITPPLSEKWFVCVQSIFHIPTTL